MKHSLNVFSQALACGTNVILTPETSLELNGLGVLDPIGASLSFDDRADGYGRGEGIGVVVLKRMSDALRDGDSKCFTRWLPCIEKNWHVSDEHLDSHSCSHPKHGSEP